MELLAVGVITATHGLTGELKLKSFSGNVDHLRALTEAVFRRGGEDRILAIESIRPQPPGGIIRIAGFDTPEKARGLLGFEMWIPRQAAVSLGDGEYYMADLCKCSVWHGDELIGKVRSVWEGGSTQLLEIEASSGKTFLVPFIGHFVGDVDLVSGRISLLGDELFR